MTWGLRRPGDWSSRPYSRVYARSSSDTAVRPLLDIEARDAGEGLVGVARVDLLEEALGDRTDRDLLTQALIRAGVRHPGLHESELAIVHRRSRECGHLELFLDLNSLASGLAYQLVRSLGSRVARVVISSVTLDILHMQLDLRGSSRSERLRSNERFRAQLELERLRELVYVHVAQLRPGEARYVDRRARRNAERERSESGPQASAKDESDEHSFVTEDRQMMASYWAYRSGQSPRCPVILVTSDFTLAHFCRAEQAEFLFAPVARRSLSSGAEHDWNPETVWFDPYALGFRWVTREAILWELALVYRDLLVGPDDSAPPDFNDPGPDFLGLRYDREAHSPRAAPRIEILADRASAHAAPGSGAPPPSPPISKRRIDISLERIAQVLPLPGQAPAQLSDLDLSEDGLRQVRIVGDATGIFASDAEGQVSEGPEFRDFWAELERREYVALNERFRRIPAYAKVIEQASEDGRFPSSKVAGSLTGWAVVLGAAYKTRDGALFGLEDLDLQAFETVLRETHARLGGGAEAVPLPRVLDSVCRQARISPVRFGELLARVSETRSGVECQKALLEEDKSMPSHPLLVLPRQGERQSYLQSMDYSRGLTIHGEFLGSLVIASGG